MAFVQDSMMPTAPATTSPNTSPLSKRRRFAPNSIPVIQCVDNSDILDHTFNSPLMLQLCEQSPSIQEIEAQLLQVGMRVRKSVSDGYQTTPRHAFTPRPFFNANRLSPELQAALTGNNTYEEQFSAGGLHKVGNMAMQPTSTVTFCGISLAALSHISGGEPVEEQKMWSYSTSHKRTYEDDSDSDESTQDPSMPHTPRLSPYVEESMPMDYFNIDMDNMSEVSPMTQVPIFEAAQARLRKFAQPKSRTRGSLATAITNQFNPFAEMSGAQQSWSTHKRVKSLGFDFGEAPFLQRREDVEMDCS